jgi:hypothetical protein
MMQLEAMPLLEALAALDLVFDPDEQRRVLFRWRDEPGNWALAREVERLVEGRAPALRRARRLGYEVMRAVRRARPARTFTGPLPLRDLGPAADAP